MLTSVAWVDWSAGSLPPESLWFGKFDIIYFGAPCFLRWSESRDQLLLLTFFLVLNPLSHVSTYQPSPSRPRPTPFPSAAPLSSAVSSMPPMLAGRAARSCSASEGGVAASTSARRHQARPTGASSSGACRARSRRTGLRVSILIGCACMAVVWVVGTLMRCFLPAFRANSCWTLSSRVAYHRTRLTIGVSQLGRGRKPTQLQGCGQLPDPFAGSPSKPWCAHFRDAGATMILTLRSPPVFERGDFIAPVVTLTALSRLCTLKN